MAIGAPHTEMHAGARKRSSGPFNVISRPSVPEGFPTKILATVIKIYCQNSMHVEKQKMYVMGVP